MEKFINFEKVEQTIRENAINPDVWNMEAVKEDIIYQSDINGGTHAEIISKFESKSGTPIEIEFSRDDKFSEDGEAILETIITIK